MTSRGNERLRAGISTTAGQWKWSNYRATAGLGPAPAWLETEWTLEQFSPRREAERRYRGFVAEGRALGMPRGRNWSRRSTWAARGFARESRRWFPRGTQPADSATPTASRSSAAGGHRRCGVARVRRAGVQPTPQTSDPRAPGRGVPGPPRGSLEAAGVRAGSWRPRLDGLSPGNLRRAAGAGESPLPAEPPSHPTVPSRTHRFTDLTPIWGS